MLKFAIAAPIVALLFSTPALAVETTVAEVIVAAPDNTVRLDVVISGDTGPRTVIVSDRPGINCGPDQYKYTQGENRQCWVWVRRSRPVLLSAKGMKGQFGQDWNIDWTGCDVQDGGARCRVLSEEDNTVTAHLRGVPQ